MADIRRRKFIAVLGGMTVAWPLKTRAQQPVKKIGFLSVSSPSSHAPFVAAFTGGDRGLRGRTIVSQTAGVCLDYRAFDGGPVPIHSRFTDEGKIRHNACAPSSRPLRSLMPRKSCQGLTRALLA